MHDGIREMLEVEIATIERRLEALRGAMDLLKAAPPVPVSRGGNAAFDTLIGVVSVYHKIAPEVILSRDKHEDVAWARMTLMWLARKQLGMSFGQIGARCGRDHGTAIAACRRVDERLELDGKERAKVEELLSKAQEAIGWHPTKTKKG